MIMKKMGNVKKLMHIVGVSIKILFKLANVIVHNNPWF
jgi:hypothetical protein